MYDLKRPSAFLLSTVLLLTLTVCGLLFCPMVSAVGASPEHPHGTMSQTGQCPESLTSFDTPFHADGPVATLPACNLSAVMDGIPHPMASHRWMAGESPHRVEPLRFLLFSVFLN